MSYIENDVDNSAGREGENTQEPAANKAIDANEASKIANILEGLRFPATKEQIIKYIADGKSIALSVENARNTSKYIDDNLKDGKKYNNTYEVERALGLVVKRNNDQIYTRDKALNEANRKRFGEETRRNPYNVTKGNKKNHSK